MSTKWMLPLCVPTATRLLYRDRAGAAAKADTGEPNAAKRAACSNDS